MYRWERNTLTVLGVLTVGYAVVVLGYVATSPDLGLRVLVSDPVAQRGEGVLVQGVVGLDYRGDVPIARGDTIVQIRRVPIRSFFDFTRELHRLHSAPIPPDGQLGNWVDPSLVMTSLPALVNVEDGPRMVEVRFRKAGSNIERVGWLAVQSQPLSEVSLTFFWLVLELVIFVVGAFGYWRRPFDPSARMFFVMCLVTTGAFVGGYHWWVIAGTLVLNLPFIMYAVFLPAVTLHFFLVFPHPREPLIRTPIRTLIGLYVVPVVFGLGITSAVVSAYALGAIEGQVEVVAWILRATRLAIYSYIVVSAVYFALTLLTLIRSFSSSGNQIERQQVAWILWAGIASTIPLGWTLYLAESDRVGFALGRGRIPMFLASLSFMLAYAIGIVRHKLMLPDDVAGKGVLYYLVSFGITVGAGAAIAVSTLASQVVTVTLITTQRIALFSILLLAIVVLFWLRDRLQRLIDRRFFREKYQLDKALQQMNRAVGSVLDRDTLSGMMLGSCREVLRVEKTGLYHRRENRDEFELTAVLGSDDLPFIVDADPVLLDDLAGEGSLQRVTSVKRSSMTGAQLLLHDLRCDLIHTIESEEGINGFVVLGERSNGNSFSAEDLTFLNAMVQITNVALHGAKVSEDVARLNEELRNKVERIADQRRQIEVLQAELTTHDVWDIDGTANPSTDAEEPDFDRHDFKGESPAILRVLDTVRKVSGSESTILVRGESGTGKEMLAELLHVNSPRSSGPMVRVHCASLSPTLLESELFGHTKGAFTGAHKDRIGRFEAAHGGTLFLDEIGDISLETQIKLLRVLQERSFEPVGGTRAVRVDVRLITATHQDLEELIRRGRFREDLLYRLNVISIHLPPLRERREDLIELSMHFLKRSTARIGKRITHIEEDALAELERYDWPGNIRQLQNVIERAVVLADHDCVSLADLPAELLTGRDPVPLVAGREAPRPRLGDSETVSKSTEDRVPVSAAPRLADNEKTELVRVMDECRGNKAEAARRMGIPRSTPYSRLKKLGID